MQETTLETILYTRHMTSFIKAGHTYYQECVQWPSRGQRCNLYTGHEGANRAYQVEQKLVGVDRNLMGNFLILPEFEENLL